MSNNALAVVLGLVVTLLGVMQAASLIDDVFNPFHHPVPVWMTILRAVVAFIAITGGGVILIMAGFG